MARRTATTYRATRTTTTNGDEEAQDAGAAAPQGEDKSLGLAEALAIGTTLLLIAAILVLDAYVGKRYGDGIFFH